MDPNEIKPWDRTEKDYLAIMADGEAHNFGEYDDISLLWDLRNKGLVESVTDKMSVATSMATSVWLQITPAGREALDGAGVVSS